MAKLKWKRKSGCLRAIEGTFQVKIEGPAESGMAFLSFKGPDGAWWEPRAMPDVEAAKKCAEELCDIYKESELQSSASLEERRERAARYAAMPDQDKAVLNFFRIYVRWPEHKKLQVRLVRPDLKEMLDEFDKLIAEEEAGGTGT